MSRAGILARVMAALSAGIAGPSMAPTFGQRYGHAPKSHNGGQQSGVATNKRAAQRRRNIRKNPRGSR